MAARWACRWELSCGGSPDDFPRETDEEPLHVADTNRSDEVRQVFNGLYAHELLRRRQQGRADIELGAREAEQARVITAWTLFTVKSMSESTCQPRHVFRLPTGSYGLLARST